MVRDATLRVAPHHEARKWAKEEDELEDAMIRPRRVGHATFETPDLAKTIAYYTGVNGLVLSHKDKDRAYLASKTGLLTIALEQGGEENLKKISFEVAP